MDNPKQPPAGSKLYYEPGLEPGGDHLVLETQDPHEFVVLSVETFPDIDPKSLPLAPFGPD